MTDADVRHETVNKRKTNVSFRSFLLGTAVLCAAGTAVWLARAPLAELGVRQALSARGIDSAATIRALSPGLVEIERLRLGAARAPAVEAEALTLRFSVDWRRRQLVVDDVSVRGGVLRIAVTEKGLDWGALAPLLAPQDGPPRVRLGRASVADARVEVTSPAGLWVVAVTGAAGPHAGGSATLRLVAAPAQLLPDYAPGAITGHVEARLRAGEGPLALRLDSRGVDVRAAGLRARRIVGALDADTRIAAGGLGAVAARGALRAQAIDGQGGGVGAAALAIERFDLAPGAAGWGDPALGLDARATIAAPRADGWRARQGAASLALVREVGGATQARWSAGADGLAGPVGSAARAEADGRLEARWPALSAAPVGAAPVTLRVSGARPSPALQTDLVRLAAAPGAAGALAAAVARTLDAGMDAAARAVVRFGDGPASLALGGPVAATAGRMRAAFTPTGPTAATFAPFAAQAAGVLTLSGGGAPDARLRLTRLRADADGVSAAGAVTVAPWTGGGVTAGVEEAAVTLTVARGEPRLTLEGALAASLPGADGLAVRGAVALAGGQASAASCLDLAWRSLAAGAATVGPGRGRLCPVNGPIRVGPSGLSGGARLTIQETVLSLADQAFTLAPLDATLTGERAGRAGPIRFAASPSVTGAAGGGPVTAQAHLAGEVALTRAGWTLDGRLSDAAFAAFGATGDAEGRVHLAASDGALTGALDSLRVRVRDTAAAPRFGGLVAIGAGVVAADGLAADLDLATDGGARLGAIAVRQPFGDAPGGATARLDAMRFTRRGLQPHDLVPPLRGVIADVEGAIQADVSARWGGGGPFAMSGVIATSDLDFATGLGPVFDVAGAVVVDDLLTITSPPRQVVTIGSFNPGVPLENGVFQFNLPGGARVAVEDARWPFAGGVLFLDPVVWTIGEPRQTVQVDLEEVDLQSLVEVLRVPDLQTAGVVRGGFPIVVENGVARIEGGRLTAKEGGGVIRYTGLAGDAAASGGFMSELAFEALKNLRFEILEIRVDGPLTGDLTVGVTFQGLNPDVVEGHPFRFNVNATGPFAQLARSLGGARRQGQAIGERVRDLMERPRPGPSPAPPAPPAP